MSGICTRFPCSAEQDLRVRRCVSPGRAGATKAVYEIVMLCGVSRPPQSIQKAPVCFLNIKKQTGALLQVSIVSSCYLLCVNQPLHTWDHKTTAFYADEDSDSPDLDYGYQMYPRAFSYLLMGKPTMAAFRPHRLPLSAVFAARQTTLETPSSSQFRASRFLFLSPQTILDNLRLQIFG